MADTKKNYEIKGNTIIANVEKLNENELKAVKNYVALGYTLINDKIKSGVTKDTMLKELEECPEVKADFEKAYSIKAKEVKEEVKEKIELLETLANKYGIKSKTKAGKYIAGYHLACQIYTKWKKEQSKK